MEYKGQEKKSVLPPKKYSLSFKRAIVREFEKGGLNKDQLRVKYGIGGKGSILVWCRKYGKLYYQPIGALPGVVMQDPQKQRIKELEARLKDSQFEVKDLILNGPEQLWVSDITYLETLSGYCYLHLITDAYSKKIMGYELCENMEASSTLKALKMAIPRRKYPSKQLIHHSDRGLQYCSRIYTEAFSANNIRISMTENGDPYENAVAERINGILKGEFGLSERFENLEQCHRQLKQSIQIYNTQRPHLSCMMLTPEQMHNQSDIQVKTWHKKPSKLK